MPTYGPNLLSNPGAEASTAGWSNFVQSTVDRVTTPVRTGSGAFRLTGTGPGECGIIDGSVAVSAGYKVRVEAYVRSATVSRETVFYLDYNNFGGSTGTTATYSSTLGWTQILGEFTVPTGVTAATPYLKILGTTTSEIHYLDDISVAAEVINAAPVANAGPDQSVSAGSVVTLTGSGTDSDGTITGYTWTLATRPSGSAAALSGTGATRTFTADVVGTYVASLVVTDDLGASSTADTVTITAATPSTLGPTVLIRNAAGTAFERHKIQVRNDANTTWIWE